MMNHGDVDRRTNRWWRHHRQCDEEPCEDIRRFLKCVLHKTRNIVCKPSITWGVRNDDDECFHGVNTVTNVSLVLVDRRCHCGETTCSQTQRLCQWTWTWRVPQTMTQYSQRYSSVSVLTRTSTVAHRSKDHTIIKPPGDGSEDVLKHTYDLVVSFQKSRTRWHIKTTGLNTTRGGRMLVLRYHWRRGRKANLSKRQPRTL